MSANARQLGPANRPSCVPRCGRLIARRNLLLLFLFPAIAGAQKFYTYTGQIGASSVLIAWGTADSSGNTIGRASQSFGPASLKVGNKIQRSDKNWAIVTDLQPDTSYPYQVFIRDRKIGEGQVRTWPEQSDRLAFFVIGDYGTGASRQYKIAESMWAELERRRNSDNPVRFVLTMGDNIYSDVTFGSIAVRSGDEDRHWQRKFFDPYERLLREIPFLPTLGNHDGNGSENRGDLFVYLDNFFFPQNKPARWYTFSFGGLADFFALDSTDNSESGPPRPAYTRDGEQFRWLQSTLPASKAPWKIPYFHHPPFNAGPRHPASLDELRDFVDVFAKSGVKVVFNGHEHNFQFSTQDQATGGMCYVISGAGGELRPGSVIRKMRSAHIAGWSGQNHFLVVEIRGKTMSVLPVSFEEIRVQDPNGRPVKMPLVVNLR